MINNIRLTPTAYYPYKHAEALDVFLTLEGDDAEALAQYLKAVSPLTGPLDNKVVFECRTNGNKVLYVHWHDNKAYVGTDIYVRDMTRVRHFQPHT